VFVEAETHLLTQLVGRRRDVVEPRISEQSRFSAISAMAIRAPHLPTPSMPEVRIVIYLAPERQACEPYAKIRDASLPGGNATTAIGSSRLPTFCLRVLRGALAAHYLNLTSTLPDCTPPSLNVS
jgi:hypothetical protein